MKGNRLVWLTVFSVAMGYMESAVVIYLRKIYYPEGFRFPLVPLDTDIGLVEVFREAATIIMLLGIGILSAQKASLRFAYFIYCFAIWDLCYYLFLWIFLDWPQSLFTWDILFLIPVPWVGPVLTPCIISATMLLLAGSIIYFQRLGVNTKLKTKEWLLLSLGSMVVILSFIWDYLRYQDTSNQEGLSHLLSGRHEMFSEINEYIPLEFNWPVFLTGEGILLAGIIIFIVRIKSSLTTKQKIIQQWQ
jgi:hypothetical protein